MLTTEVLPAWLATWTRKSRSLVENFFASRVVFYPGSGTDGQPVRFFGSRHLAHCYVFVDYGLERDVVQHELSEIGHPLMGYRNIGRVDLRERDLTPSGWTPHLAPGDLARPLHPPLKPYSFIDILERREGFDDAHGPRRLALMILCGDGIASYDALFCQVGQRAAYAIVLQDHGTGGNWAAFGRGHQLEHLATTTNRSPELLLVAANTAAWGGYAEVTGEVEGGGGMHGHLRQLWQKSQST